MSLNRRVCKHETSSRLSANAAYWHVFANTYNVSANVCDVCVTCLQTQSSLQTRRRVCKLVGFANSSQHTYMKLDLENGFCVVSLHTILNLTAQPQVLDQQSLPPPHISTCHASILTSPHTVPSLRIWKPTRVDDVPLHASLGICNLRSSHQHPYPTMPQCAIRLCYRPRHTPFGQPKASIPAANQITLIGWANTIAPLFLIHTHPSERLLQATFPQHRRHPFWDPKAIKKGVHPNVARRRGAALSIVVCLLRLCSLRRYVYLLCSCCAA